MGLNKFYRITKDYRLEGQPVIAEQPFYFRFAGGHTEYHVIHQDGLGMYIEVFYYQHKARLDLRGLYAIRGNNA